MRILEVSRYKNNFAEYQLPFVTEQGEAIAKVLRESQVYGVKCTVYSGELRVKSVEWRGTFGIKWQR